MDCSKDLILLLDASSSEEYRHDPRPLTLLWLYPSLVFQQHPSGRRDSSTPTKYVAYTRKLFMSGNIEELQSRLKTSQTRLLSKRLRLPYPRQSSQSSPKSKARAAYAKVSRGFLSAAVSTLESQPSAPADVATANALHALFPARKTALPPRFADYPPDHTVLPLCADDLEETSSTVSKILLSTISSNRGKSAGPDGLSYDHLLHLMGSTSSPYPTFLFALNRFIRFISSGNVIPAFEPILAPAALYLWSKTTARYVQSQLVLFGAASPAQWSPSVTFKKFQTH